MNISLDKLDYAFKKKPLLFGGHAMQYYGLRHAGSDIDFIADKEDVVNLISLYPTRVKDIYGDLGVCPQEFEIWKTVHYFDYDFYRVGAIEKDSYLVISIEKLLFMKTMAKNVEKNQRDMDLIVNQCIEKQHELHDKIAAQNSRILIAVGKIEYLEHKQ